MIKRCMAAAVVVSALIFIVAKLAVADTADFQNFLKDHSTVKVYVDLKNSSGDNKVDANLLKKLIEEAFTARKAHSFIVVQTAEQADLIFKGDIIEYIWMENDPIDQVYGLETAALDAALSENYARIQIQTSLITTKHNRMLWSDRVKATMTKKPMPKEASYELIYPRFVKSAMIEIFRKPTTGGVL